MAKLDRADPAVNARYTRVAIALHWAIAAAIAYNLLSGLAGAWLPRGFFALHISSGLTILALSLVRVVWRLTHRPPPMLPMKRWEKGLAHAVHLFLYLAILLVPWTGWVMISASPPAGSPGAAYAAAERARTNPGAPARKPAMFWGVVPVPMIGPVQDLGREAAGVPEQRAFHEQMEGIHGLGGWLLLALLVLHIGGALKHQLLDRQPELQRMGLGRRRPV